MPNSFFGNNLSKIEKLRLREMETEKKAEELAWDCREEEMANWAELHCCPNQNGEWEC